VEQRAFTALAGDCELFGIGVGKTALENGEAWIHAMHGPSDALFSETSEPQPAQRRGGTWFEVSAELGALLRESLQAYELSGGLVQRGDAARTPRGGLHARLLLGGTPTSPAPPPPAPLPSCSS